jgi:peroxiredoxin
VKTKSYNLLAAIAKKIKSWHCTRPNKVSSGIEEFRKTDPLTGVIIHRMEPFRRRVLVAIAVFALLLCAVISIQSLRTLFPAHQVTSASTVALSDDKSNPSAQPIPDPWQSPLVGIIAPDFAQPALSGGICQLSRERGHVVVLDFWGSDCPPCLAELKTCIAKLADDTSLRQRGLRVWTVNAMDSQDAIANFMAANQYHFLVVSNSGGAVTNKYSSGGLPTTFLIGRDGIVRKAFAGFDTKTQQDLSNAIEAALKQ